MEVSFTAKTHSLSVTSLPSASSSSCSPSLRPVRREFLGCGHNLRSPSGLLRSHRKLCKEELGRIQIRSPRFLVRASLDSQSSLLVVTVVTFSALTLVSLNFSERKKRKNVGEVSWFTLVFYSHVSELFVWLRLLLFYCQRWTQLRRTLHAHYGFEQFSTRPTKSSGKNVIFSKILCGTILLSKMNRNIWDCKLL